MLLALLLLLSKAEGALIVCVWEGGFLPSAINEGKYPGWPEFSSDDERHRRCSRQVLFHTAYPKMALLALVRGREAALARTLHPPMKRKQRATRSVVRLDFLSSLIFTHPCRGRSWRLCREGVPLRSQRPVGRCSCQSVAELPSIIQRVLQTAGSSEEKLPL